MKKNLALFVIILAVAGYALAQSADIKMQKTLDLFALLQSPHDKEDGTLKDINGNDTDMVKFTPLDPAPRIAALADLVQAGADVNAFQVVLLFPDGFMDSDDLAKMESVRGKPYSEDRDFYFNADGSPRHVFTFLSSDAKAEELFGHDTDYAQSALDFTVGDLPYTTVNYSLGVKLLALGAIPTAELSKRIVKMLASSIMSYEDMLTSNSISLPFDPEDSAGVDMLTKIFESGVSSDEAITADYIYYPFLGGKFPIEDSRPELKDLTTNLLRTLVRHLHKPNIAIVTPSGDDGEDILIEIMKRMDPILVQDLFDAGFSVRQFLLDNQGSLSINGRILQNPTRAQALAAVKEVVAEDAHDVGTPAQATQIVNILETQFAK